MGGHCKSSCYPAEIVLTDEPTANLDHKTGEGILQLIKEINGNFKTTFIFSTDDARVMAMGPSRIYRRRAASEGRGKGREETRNHTRGATRRKSGDRRRRLSGTNGGQR